MNELSRCRLAAAAGRAAVLLLLVLLAGCGGDDGNTPKARDDSVGSGAEPVEQPALVLAVFDDPAMGDAIARRWRSDLAGKVEVRHLTAESSPEAMKEAASADVIIYPVGWLGELVEKNMLAPAPQDVLRNRALDRRDIFDLARQQEAAWGETVYAIPFGSPQLTLYYRPDLFDRLGLKPPQTWTDYQQAAEALRQDGQAPLTCLEPLGPGWAGQMLLARAAAYARHRSQYSTLFNYTTMEPLIAGPPFVKALQELADFASGIPADKRRMSPHDLRQEFWSGRAAMVISWPTGAEGSAGQNGATVNDAPAGEKPPPVAFAPLPGAKEAYNIRNSQWETKPPDETWRTPLIGVAGRLGSVTSRSKHPQAAFNLLAHAAGRDWSSQISPLSRDTTLFRSSHLPGIAKWVEATVPAEAAKQYGELIAAQQTGASWLSSPQIPGRSEYLAALDEAVVGVVEGDQSPQSALDAAAEKWREITARLGVERQRIAYEKSLGLEP